MKLDGGFRKLRELVARDLKSSATETKRGRPAFCALLIFPLLLLRRRRGDHIVTEINVEDALSLALASGLLEFTLFGGEETTI